MVKRGKLEIIRDILEIVKSHKKIKATPLSRKSKISSIRFKEYYQELVDRGLIKILFEKNDKFILLTEKGNLFIERYKTIKDFIIEFDL